MCVCLCVCVSNIMEEEKLGFETGFQQGVAYMATARVFSFLGSHLALRIVVGFSFGSAPHLTSVSFILRLSPGI